MLIKNDVQRNNKNNCDATLILLVPETCISSSSYETSTLYSSHFPTFPTFLVKPAHYTRVTFLKKSSPKVFKNLPKTGSSNQPWLTANAKLGTSFFGTFKNPTIFKFQIVLALEHVSTPLVSKHKSHVFPLRTNERTDGRTEI